MPDLYAAQLDGFDLEIETIDDAFEKAIVRHEFPYKNGALLEDMGQKARVVKIRCYFWDDGADHATYETHRDLLSHLQSQETSELVHPKYGPLRGGVESMSVRHDERERTVEIDITFVEGVLEASGVTSQADIEASAEEAYNDGIADQMQEFEDDMQAALGPEAPGLLARVLDPALGIIEQFSDVSSKARSYLKEVESYVATLEATLNTIANPANSLVATINYGVNLPGRVLGSVSRCVERYALLYDSSKNAPARFVQSLTFGLKGLAVASGKFGKTTVIAAAHHTALQTAYCYKFDETVRVAAKKSEGRRAFDALGNYTSTPLSASTSTPRETAGPMTVPELESSLATVRGSLQEAIDLSRQNSSLKQQALQLQTHVNSIKLEREKIIRVQLDNPMPLHLVCLRYGLPYNAAERLLAINAIRNPNLTSGEVSVYVS